MRLARFAAALCAAVLVVAAPATSFAQFGGGGGMGGGGRGGMGGRGGGMGGMGGRGGMQGGGMRRADPMINSVDLILKNAHDLVLTDSQVVRLTTVKAHQDSSLGALRLRLDSLAGQRGDGDPMVQQGRQQARGEAMVAYRDVLKQGREAAFGVLEKKQRKQTEKLEKALKKEMASDGPADGGRWPGARQSTVTHGLARLAPAR